MHFIKGLFEFWTVYIHLAILTTLNFEWKTLRLNLYFNPPSTSIEKSLGKYLDIDLRE